MANPEVDKRIRIKDSLIQVNTQLTFDELWNATLATNAVLLKAEQNTRLAQLDYKSIPIAQLPLPEAEYGLWLYAEQIRHLAQ